MSNCVRTPPEMGMEEATPFRLSGADMATMLEHPRTESYDRDDPAERIFAVLVRDAYSTELLTRLDASLNRQLEAFFETQTVPRVRSRRFG
jgi:hypothetical protein